MNDNDFFRSADEQEKKLIAEYEHGLYKRELTSAVFLLLIFVISVAAAVISYFIPIGFGAVLRIFIIIAGAFLIAVTILSIKIIKRQLAKIMSGDYGVQNVTITETHNEIRGLSSDQIVTFTSGSGASYVMNTRTTGDMSLAAGKAGLLVIISGEENVLLTRKYRFFAEV